MIYTQNMNFSCLEARLSLAGGKGFRRGPRLFPHYCSEVLEMEVQLFSDSYLFQGLRDFVAGKSQPWGSLVGSSPPRNHHLRGEQGMPDPVAFVACSTVDDNNESARTTPRFASSGSTSGRGEAGAAPGYAMWMGKEEALLEGGTRAPPRRSGDCFSSTLGQQEDECGGTAMDVVDSR